MLIKLNSDNIKKLKNKGKRASCLILSGLLTTTLLTGCNMTMLDTKFGFDKALILGDDTSIIASVTEWKDYSGEQLQFTIEDGLIVLSSSFDTNCFYGESSKYSAEEVAKNALSENGEIYNIGANTSKTTFNKDMLDTNWTFNKTVTFNGNNAAIFSVAKWTDYSGEQLQIITPDGLIANLCTYNSKLLYDKESKTTAFDFASYYVGTDGKVTDFSYTDEEAQSFNYDIIDTKYGFNKAIVLKEGGAIIFPITKWCDYEGEQLQLTIENGPMIVTAAYDTILINDIESKTKAIDIAKSLLSDGQVKDLTEGYNYDSQITFNGTILDFAYGFPSGIISNSNSATALQITKWDDYEGEQLQIELPTGDIILTSSMFLDLLNGGTEEVNASTIARDYINEYGKIIDYANNDHSSRKHNKNLVDTTLSFKYALKIIDGNVTIIPLKKWQDFANTDGSRDKQDSPNCEQIQLVLPEDTAIVTTTYDTILVKNVSDIYDIAEIFRGPSGVISDLTPYVGNPSTNFNLSLIDTKYYFDYAIFTNGITSQIFPLSKWKDFKEGEQLQISLPDDTGFLTSFVNTTLVSPKTDNIEEILASAFSGNLEEKKGLVKKYN